MIFDLTLGKRLFADLGPVKKFIFFVGRIVKNSGNNPLFGWRYHKRTPQAIEWSVFYASEKIIGGLKIVPNGDPRQNQTNGDSKQKDSAAQET